MRLFRNSIRKPRYSIYFYEDWDVKYEMNGDRPWIMLDYLMPKFESKDLKPPWQIQLFSPDKRTFKLERDLFLGGSQLSKSLIDFIEESELNYNPKEYLEEILVDHNSGEQVDIANKDNIQISFIARFEALIKGTDHYQEYLTQKEKEFTLERMLENVFQ
jgi:hypothetical protein